MTIDEIHERLAADYYRVPWPVLADYARTAPEEVKAVGRELRQKHRDDEERKNEEFERDLAAACGVADHPKRAKLWSLAWEHGHACGLSDVVAYYTDFVELIK